MCAVDGDYLADDGSRLDEGSGKLVEDPEVCLLSNAVSELGEEAVARGSASEAACSGYFSVVFEA